MFPVEICTFGILVFPDPFDCGWMAWSDVLLERRNAGNAVMAWNGGLMIYNLKKISKSCILTP